MNVVRGVIISSEEKASIASGESGKPHRLVNGFSLLIKIGIPVLRRGAVACIPGRKTAVYGKCMGKQVLRGVVIRSRLIIPTT